MSSLLRTRLATAARSAAPQATRRASTIPHRYTPPHYTLNERFHKFVPVEAYPLIGAVMCMTSFGLTYGVKAFSAVPGELRLVPDRYASKSSRKEVWED